MSFSIGFDDRWRRDIGYGVPAYCDAPGCFAEIDRGLSYVCGSEPYGGERGCGLYFCEKHLGFHRFRGADSGGSYCKRCIAHKPTYKPTPDHPDWLHHKATDPSWAEWREEQARCAAEPQPAATQQPKGGGE